MNQDIVAITSGGQHFLTEFEELFDQIHTSQISIMDYLNRLDSLEIPQAIVITSNINDFKANVNNLIENKNHNGFQNAELYLMQSNIENFYQFIEAVKQNQQEIELNLLARFILEYLQDTRTSHLPQFLFTALAGTRNRGFVTAVTRRIDLPL